jgi:hypothetical protein
MEQFISLQQGNADSLVWHLGVDMDKVIRRKYMLMCLMTPDEMVSFFSI